MNLHNYLYKNFITYLVPDDYENNLQSFYKKPTFEILYTLFKYLKYNLDLVVVYKKLF